MALAALPVIDCCTPLAGSSLSAERGAELEIVLKALADRHRLRIVNLLLRAGGEPVCVCEVQPLLGLSQGTVSHHLKLLVEAGIAARETRGTYSYFTLVPGALDAVRGVFSVPRRVALPGGDRDSIACC
ncbi:MAG TPA: metalloregulator ArsR/SmtB family transcription factor [Solirubrobacterales bacterium]|nr:metalloregulator ArsR/SmtB family transcription factor [Solirubrobacterales bacterium]